MTAHRIAQPVILAFALPFRFHRDQPPTPSSSRLPENHRQCTSTGPNSPNSPLQIPFRITIHIPPQRGPFQFSFPPPPKFILNNLSLPETSRLPSCHFSLHSQSPALRREPPARHRPHIHSSVITSLPLSLPSPLSASWIATLLLNLLIAAGQHRNAPPYTFFGRTPPTTRAYAPVLAHALPALPVLCQLGRATYRIQYLTPVRMPPTATMPIQFPSCSPVLRTSCLPRLDRPGSRPAG